MSISELAKWHIGAEARDQRILKKLSKPEVATFFGVVPATITNWEKGESTPGAGEIYGMQKLLGFDDERTEYMADVVRGRATLNLEANPRHNALCLARAEVHYGSIWKWEPNILPGIVQTRAYNSKYLQPTEGTTDQQAQFGWRFKQARQEALLQRRDKYRMSIIIQDIAISRLHEIPPEDRREQLKHLQECNSRPGWELRVMDHAHHLGDAFDVYVAAGSPSAGPPFVYTQIHDLSWCIEELERVKLYHELIKKHWPRATPLEEFLDAHRDLLA